MIQMTRNIRNLFGLLALVLVSRMALGQSTPARPLPERELRALATIVTTLQESFVTPVSGERLLEAAIRGMLREIDPDGGEYFSEEEFKAFREGKAAETAGIGIQLRSRGDELLLAPIPGGPAEEAGLRPGDVLLSVDGKAIKGMRGPQALLWLAGPVASTVKVGIRRECVPKPIQLEIVRRKVVLPEVSLSRPSSELAVLHVPAFREHALEEIATTLGREWQKQRFQGLVLDMRRNTGGLLDHAVGLAAIFLPQNAVVTRSSGTAAEANVVYLAAPSNYARRGGRDPLVDLPKELREVPLVVLVDEGTSAGAEIVVAALKDHQRATVVGRQTFGRGSIQTIRPLGANAGVKYTTAYWVSPQGSQIHGYGIEPQELVEAMDPEKELNAALATLRKRL